MGFAPRLLVEFGGGPGRGFKKEKISLIINEIVIPGRVVGRFFPPGLIRDISSRTAPPGQIGIIET